MTTYKNIMIKSGKAVIWVGMCLLALASCKDNGQKPNNAEATTTEPTPAKVNTPVFDADSAFSSVAYQVSLGPRTPGSTAQKTCANWMQQHLTRFCDTVYRQQVKVTGGDNKQLDCINLIGVIHPKATRRILFLTHWDSRPWADQDKTDKDKPILAADDAGSGVGVLIEMARQIKAFGLSPEIGVDILLEDVEDYGRSEWSEKSYCLGTQYWANHPHVPGYRADFGILLDMVGAKNAQFPLEATSTQLAGNVQQKVWKSASRAGYSSYFIYTEGAPITDDHVPVNQIMGIKTIDVINLSTSPQGGAFAPHWHTHADNLDIIDKNTLKAVGQSMLQVVYDEAAGSL